MSCGMTRTCILLAIRSQRDKRGGGERSKGKGAGNRKGQHRRTVTLSMGHDRWTLWKWGFGSFCINHSPHLFSHHSSSRLPLPCNHHINLLGTDNSKARKLVLKTTNSILHQDQTLHPGQFQQRTEKKRMSKDQPKWLPPTTPPPDDLYSIPLPSLPNSNLASSSSTTLYPRSQPQTQNQPTKQNNLNAKPSSTSTSTSPALPTSAAYAETNNTNTSTTLHTTVNGGAGYLPSERPSGVPRCIVRVDRDHDAGDEATRFEAEMFPIEFVGRVSKPRKKCPRETEEYRQHK